MHFDRSLKHANDPRGLGSVPDLHFFLRLVLRSGSEPSCLVSLFLLLRSIHSNRSFGKPIDQTVLYSGFAPIPRIQQERLYSTLSSSLRFFITHRLTEKLLASYSSHFILVFSQFLSLMLSLPLPTDLLLSIADAGWFLLRRFPSADTLLINTLIHMLTVFPLCHSSLGDLRETRRFAILARVFASRRRRSSTSQGAKALPKRSSGAAAMDSGGVASPAPPFASPLAVDAVHVHRRSETDRENGEEMRSRAPVSDKQQCVRRLFR